MFLFSFFFFPSFFDIFHTFSLLPILPNYVHPSAGGGAWSIRINSGNSDVLTDSKKIFAKKKSERNLCKGFVPQNHQHYWCRQEPPQVFCTLQSKRDHQISTLLRAFIVGNIIFNILVHYESLQKMLSS